LSEKSPRGALATYAIRHGLVHLVAKGERAGLSRWLGQPILVNRFRFAAKDDEPSLFARLWRVQGSPEPWSAYLRWRERPGLKAEQGLIAVDCVQELGAPGGVVAELVTWISEREAELDEAGRLRLAVLRGANPAFRSERARNLAAFGNQLKELKPPAGMEAVAEAVARQAVNGPTREALEGYLALLRKGGIGALHFTVCKAAVEVAMALKDGAAADEAVSLMAPGWEQHPDALVRAQCNRLAALAAKVSARRAVAVDHARAFAAAMAEAMGASHPRTWAARRELAVMLAEAGALSEALAEAEAVYAWRLDRLGAADPETASSRGTCADILKGLGRHEEELPLRREAVELLRARKGVLKSDLVEPRRALANCLEKLGRFAEELSVRRKLLDAYKASLEKGKSQGYWALVRSLLAARRAGDGTAFRELVDVWLPAQVPPGLAAEVRAALEDALR
jgi:tetratricopeptide (TPR) repeat protein